MNYSALIQNRKSSREFSARSVPAAAVAQIEAYYQNGCQRLVPGIATELRIFGTEAKAALESAAGYQDFLVGAPNYLVLLSAQDPCAVVNAGYIMEDLILKLTEMDLGSCWITFTDSDRVKQALGIQSGMDVAAIAAFGEGVKGLRRLRFNLLSMKNVDNAAKRQYFAPKKGVYEMAFVDRWGKTDGLDDHIGFYEDMLWEALYAASLSPSYLNRQPYGFVVCGSSVTLVETADAYTDRIDGDLDLGVVLLHFAAAASQWSGHVAWKLGAEAGQLALPEGYRVVAACTL